MYVRLQLSYDSAKLGNSFFVFPLLFGQGLQYNRLREKTIWMNGILRVCSLVPNKNKYKNLDELSIGLIIFYYKCFPSIFYLAVFIRFLSTYQSMRSGKLAILGSVMLCGRYITCYTTVLRMTVTSENFLYQLQVLDRTLFNI